MALPSPRREGSGRGDAPTTLGAREGGGRRCSDHPLFLGPPGRAAGALVGSFSLFRGPAALLEPVPWWRLTWPPKVCALGGGQQSQPERALGPEPGVWTRLPTEDMEDVGSRPRTRGVPGLLKPEGTCALTWAVKPGDSWASRFKTKQSRAWSLAVGVARVESAAQGHTESPCPQGPHLPPPGLP